MTTNRSGGLVAADLYDEAGNQLQYGYDLKGQTTSIKYPCGTNTVTQGFDDAGRMTSVQDWLSHTTQYKYDANRNNYEIDYVANEYTRAG